MVPSGLVIVLTGLPNAWPPGAASDSERLGLYPSMLGGLWTLDCLCRFTRLSVNGTWNETGFQAYVCSKRNQKCSAGGWTMLLIIGRAIKAGQLELLMQLPPELSCTAGLQTSFVCKQRCSGCRTPQAVAWPSQSDRQRSSRMHATSCHPWRCGSSLWGCIHRHAALMLGSTHQMRQSASQPATLSS